MQGFIRRINAALNQLPCCCLKKPIKRRPGHPKRGHPSVLPTRCYGLLCVGHFLALLLLKPALAHDSPADRSEPDHFIPVVGTDPKRVEALVF